MTRSLDDPQYVGRVAGVISDFDYHVEFAGRRSPTYRVTVFDYPNLMRADAQVDYPTYTRLSPKLIEDVRRITAVEGTKLTLLCRLNKDIAEAQLVDRDGEVLALTRQEGAEPVYQASFELEQSRRFKLQLTDAQGRKNKLPPDFLVNVTLDQPPTMEIARPGRDVRVSPLEELTIAAKVTDDFGLLHAGISYSLGGEPPREVALTKELANEKAEAPKSAAVSHIIDFESLKSQPDQLVAYYLWADDIGPDGKTRRTMTDMYFAEVRRFEEIFRQGEQQPQQQGGAGAGQQAEELAELEKQVASATWSLIRRETAAKPSPEFATDAGVIQEGQQQALDQLAELGSQLDDDQSRAFFEEAKKHMTAASDELTKAVDGLALEPLTPALSAAQAAYQSLLKLRAREFQVSRSSQGGQGGGGSAMQRQLDQLELSNDENRYETESRAQAQKENAEQLDESRKLLQRLRELARRQEDVNDRVRELQSALAAAEAENERQELQRQLKRLRDQQRELVRDAEALQNDMQSSENANSLQQSEQQLGQTRSRVQKASEALEQGDLSQALNAGARAANELNKLRDDFRQRTADRFTDEMQQLRKSARELDERQQQLSEQLSDLNAGGRRSLRDSAGDEGLAEQLNQQKRDVSNALEQVRATVAEAEEPEPLLARQLYETTRRVDEQQTEQALDAARQLAQAGATREAGDPMRAASRGVRELREGVEQAAESVLGDETEALRRANEQLRDLGDEMNREVERGRRQAGDARGEPRSGPGRDEAPSDRQAQGDERANGEGAEPGEGQGRAPGEQQGEGRGSGGRSQDIPPPDPARSGGAPSPESEDRSNVNQPQPGRGGTAGDQPGPGDSREPAQGANGRGAGQGQPGEQPNGQGAQGDGQRGGQGSGPGGAPNGLGGLGGGAPNLDDFARDAAERGPITGDNFRQWSEGMRDVEDMLDDPDLAAEVARIRDRAEQARAEFTRHAQKPDWTKLNNLVVEPMVELSARIEEEIRRKQSPDALAPIDRDSAPTEYADQVRQYYERLGSGR